MLSLSRDGKTHVFPLSCRPCPVVRGPGTVSFGRSSDGSRMVAYERNAILLLPYPTGRGVSLIHTPTHTHTHAPASIACTREGCAHATCATIKKVSKNRTTIGMGFFAAVPCLSSPLSPPHRDALFISFSSVFPFRRPDRRPCFGSFCTHTPTPRSRGALRRGKTCPRTRISLPVFVEVHVFPILFSPLCVGLFSSPFPYAACVKVCVCV